MSTIDVEYLAGLIDDLDADVPVFVVGWPLGQRREIGAVELVERYQVDGSIAERRVEIELRRPVERGGDDG
jgi:hypothetical protein